MPRIENAKRKIKMTKPVAANEERIAKDQNQAWGSAPSPDHKTKSTEDKEHTGAYKMCILRNTEPKEIPKNQLKNEVV